MIFHRIFSVAEYSYKCVKSLPGVLLFGTLSVTKSYYKQISITYIRFEFFWKDWQIRIWQPFPNIAEKHQRSEGISVHWKLLFTYIFVCCLCVYWYFLRHKLQNFLVCFYYLCTDFLQCRDSSFSCDVHWFESNIKRFVRCEQLTQSLTYRHSNRNKFEM